MDPDPLRLLETAHPLRSGSISQGPPKPRFRIRPNCRLKRPPKLVNKTVNNFIKIVDGPTQMSRRRSRPPSLQLSLVSCSLDAEDRASSPGRGPRKQRPVNYHGSELRTATAVARAS